MKRGFLLSLTTLITMSCVTINTYAEQTHHQLQVREIDAIIGQWNYDLLTKDGTKIKGFFQVEPSSNGKLSVVGQAYFDKGNKMLSTKNLRGVWTGSMQRDKQQQDYVLTFLMRENPIYPNTPAESPYHGTIYFHHKGNFLEGKFSDHDSREGIGGTITAYKHQ
jgi:hypothetical protein